MRTVYSALYDEFAHLDHLPGVVHCKGLVDPEDMTDQDSILILHGGADISPSIYGQKVGHWTGAKETPSIRDNVERRFVEKAVKMGIPIFGICRGAQLLCAEAGGTLIQHTTGHGGVKHWLTCSDGEEFLANSFHHQMLNLQGTKHELIAHCKNKLSQAYYGENDEKLEIDVEPEIVFFPEMRALAVQGHPEWSAKESKFVQYCLKLISEKLV